MGSQGISRVASFSDLHPLSLRVRAFRTSFAVGFRLPTYNAPSSFMAAVAATGLIPRDDGHVVYVGASPSCGACREKDSTPTRALTQEPQWPTGCAAPKRKVITIVIALPGCSAYNQTMPDSRYLGAIRKKLRLSQEQMARLLGVSFVTVNRWEGGHSSPTGSTLDLYLALNAAMRAGYAPGIILQAATG